MDGRKQGIKLSKMRGKNSTHRENRPNGVGSRANKNRVEAIRVRRKGEKWTRYIAVDHNNNNNNNNEGGISGYRTATERPSTAKGANGRRAATARVTPLSISLFSPFLGWFLSTRISHDPSRKDRCQQQETERNTSYTREREREREREKRVSISVNCYSRRRHARTQQRANECELWKTKTSQEQREGLRESQPFRKARLQTLVVSIYVCDCDCDCVCVLY